MLLSDLVSAYVDHRNTLRPIGKELRDRTKANMMDCAGVFSRWLNRPATIADFQPAAVNDFLISIIRAGGSPFTAKCRRTGLLILWRHAHRVGILSSPPAGVRSVHLPDRQLEGYSLADMDCLLRCAESLTGKMRRSRLPKSVYWPSLLRTKWDLGLRAGDMISIRVQDFRTEGLLWAYEQKTGKHRWHTLRPQTRNAIAECIAVDPTRECIWSGLVARSFYRAFISLAGKAGLRGSSRWVRRGASSEVNRIFPGMGWRFLNHSTLTVFEKHYRVDRICQPEPLAPPEMGIDRPQK